MIGVFSPMSVRAIIAFCTLLLTSRALAERPISDSFSDDPATTDTDWPEEEGSTTSFLVYDFLEYVTLSPQAAFDEPVPTDQILTCSGVAEHPDGPNETEQSQQLTSDLQGLSGTETTFTRQIGEPCTAVISSIAESNSTIQTDEDPTKFVARPMSGIRLDHANKPVSRTGEILKTPAIESAHSKTHAEEHYTPAPWRRGHPSRNTFPFRHQPLYFEDPNLERCDHSAGYLTEAVNIAHFAGRIPVTPYMMAANPPCETVRALPDCPSCHSFNASAYVPEPTVRSITAEAVAVTGLIFLIP